jgi:hypothetical protein
MIAVSAEAGVPAGGEKRYYRRKHELPHVYV